MHSRGVVAAALACSLSGCLDTKKDMPPLAAVDAGAWNSGAGSVKPPLAQASAGSAWVVQAGSGGAAQRSVKPVQPMAAGGGARGQAGAMADAGGRRDLPIVRARASAANMLDAGVSDASAHDAAVGDEATVDASVPDAPPEEVAEPSQPLVERAGELIITELMIDPKALPDTEGEWLELYNATDSMLELRDCQLDDGDDSLHEIPALLVEAGAYFTIAREAEPGFHADLVVPLSLTNSADSVAIVCQGHEIDRVTYDAAADFAIESGVSLALDSEQLDAQANDSASAWCEGHDPYADDLGSPGLANPSCHGEPEGESHAESESEHEAESGEEEPLDAGAGGEDAAAHDAG
jgi:hypothetical protein